MKEFFNNIDKLLSVEEKGNKLSHIKNELEIYSSLIGNLKQTNFHEYTNEISNIELLRFSDDNEFELKFQDFLDIYTLEIIPNKYITLKKNNKIFFWDKGVDKVKDKYFKKRKNAQSELNNIISNHFNNTMNLISEIVLNKSQEIKQRGTRNQKIYFDLGEINFSVSYPSDYNNLKFSMKNPNTESHSTSEGYITFPQKTIVELYDRNSYAGDVLSMVYFVSNVRKEMKKVKE